MSGTYKFENDSQRRGFMNTRESSQDSAKSYRALNSPARADTATIDDENVHYVKRGKCCARFSKTFISIATVVILLLGLAVLSVGLYSYFQLRNQVQLSSYDKPVICGVMGLGGAIVLVALIGIAGACFENRCLLISFLVLVLLLALAQVGVGLIAQLRRNSVTSELNSLWERSSNSSIAYTQSHLHCCGWTNGTRIVQPCSWTRTCSGPFHDLVVHMLNIAKFASIGIVAVEVIAILLSISLVCVVSRRSAKGEYVRVRVDSDA